jgi:hypothetical protein
VLYAGPALLVYVGSQVPGSDQSDLQWTPPTRQIWGDNLALMQGTMVLARVSAYMGCLVKKAAEIWLHPNNFQQGYEVHF